jgi:hypothetical protein
MIYCASSTNLNYELAENTGNKLMFITGYNKDEKDLPVFDHPLIFKDHRNNLVIASDLRKYVRPDKEQALNIKDITKDTNNVNFILIRTLATQEFLSGDVGTFREIYKGITTALAMVISNIITVSLPLNPVEKVYIEIVISFYANRLFSNTNNMDELKDAVYARITNSKLSIPVNHNTVVTVMSGCNLNANTIEDLITNIKTVLPAEKANLVSTELLINSMSNLWFGPGGTEAMIIALEHMPTWIALVYSCISDNTFKRSRLAMLLDKSKRNINDKLIKTTCELFLKDKTL